MIAHANTPDQVFWGGFAIGVFCAALVVLAVFICRNVDDDAHPREDQW